MKVEKVILASDLNPHYLQFWPLVSKAWKEIIGIEPELVLISEKMIPGLENENGNVNLCKPVPNIPTPQQAQISRFFFATNFPDQVCLTSDIDMFPMSREYFMDTPKDVPDENLAVYSADSALPGMPNYPSFAIGYNAAKGSTFQEIIQGDMEAFPECLSEWLSHGHGWITDERVFYKKWLDWKDKTTRTSLFRRGYNISNDPTSINRLDRSTGCSYNLDLLKKKFYYDFHMPRPYSQHKDEIDNIVNILTEGKHFE